MIAILVSEPKARTRVELPDAVAVSFVPSRVAFDWNTGETEIRGILAKPPGSAAPDTVWVWAYFVNPTVNSIGSWSNEPIAVAPVFDTGDSAAIVARGPFHWATNSDLPRRGNFARVFVSAASPDAARVPSASRVYDTVGAIRVRSPR